ncbi:ABC transporter ATP-binding protein [Euzebya rosea]|uniref:ABC transporter ATP-binding protein n=1 Tax=Euzebya rosea TaxID=2052804 RepID=UPI000D3EB878|nr:betaine/proline/choline family ABC transporter ATP-binding protein [Euzebya rosea]
MITFEHVVKRYPDGTVAVDDLSFEVPEGEILVLVGPSGCGKTTSMRMINRMIEPTSGVIRVDGHDVMATDPAELRRGIGYVIQQIGLFPHRSVADNIGTVPRLLGWQQDRTDERVEELVEVVGLRAELAQRYPHQLSGGQRQRVGVARALAADPPVLLMDEPFGAVDPIVRGKLQEEFLRLQAEVRKTIVFVTHDIDEAIVMGDRIAILAEGGVLQQLDTPVEILARPANAFVEEFLGAERELRRLALIPVSEVTADRGPVVSPGTDTDEAARIATDAGTDWIAIVNDDRSVAGWSYVTDLNGVVAVADARPFAATVMAGDSLRTALDVLVASPNGVAVRVGPSGSYEGLVTRELVTEALR